MIPRRIAGANTKFGPPEGWDTEVNGHCGNLHARRESGLVETAWEPTPDELAALNAGGSVILTVVGGLPPVALRAEWPKEE